MNFVTCLNHVGKYRAHCFFFVCFFFSRERDRPHFFGEPDILTSKCDLVNKIKFQKNFEIVDVPLFANGDNYNHVGGYYC